MRFRGWTRRLPAKCVCPLTVDLQRPGPLSLAHRNKCTYTEICVWRARACVCMCVGGENVHWHWYSLVHYIKTQFTGLCMFHNMYHLKHLKLKQVPSFKETKIHITSIGGERNLNFRLLNVSRRFERQTSSGLSKYHTLTDRRSLARSLPLPCLARQKTRTSSRRGKSSN